MAIEQISKLQTQQRRMLIDQKRKRFEKVLHYSFDFILFMFLVRTEIIDECVCTTWVTTAALHRMQIAIWCVTALAYYRSNLSRNSPPSGFLIFLCFRETSKIWCDDAVETTKDVEMKPHPTALEPKRIVRKQLFDIDRHHKLILNCTSLLVAYRIIVNCICPITINISRK